MYRDAPNRDALAELERDLAWLERKCRRLDAETMDLERRRTWRWRGVMASLAVILSSSTGYVWQPWRGCIGTETTRHQRRLLSDVASTAAASVALGETGCSLEALAAKGYPVLSPRGTPLRYVCGLDLTLHDAGPDRRFGTSDDWTFPSSDALGTDG